jgi:endoglycosylceramidase
LPLGHAGRWITDAAGRVVILHGINMVYKRTPYAPDAIGFGDDDAAFLAHEGFDTLRLGVIYKAVRSPELSDGAESAPRATRAPAVARAACETGGGRACPR